MVTFGGCGVEVEDVANGGTEMGEAAVCDDLLTLKAEGGRGGGNTASSATTEGMLGGSWGRGVVWVSPGCVCVSVAWWGGWE